jgi:hypothetical protein
MTVDDANEHAQPEVVASFATESEAEVARAKLRAFGVDAVIDDQIEGGSVPIAGEDGVMLEVRAEDAADAAEILHVDPDDAHAE